jgi:hypothetical protein
MVDDAEVKREVSGMW